MHQEHVIATSRRGKRKDPEGNPSETDMGKHFKSRTTIPSQSLRRNRKIYITINNPYVTNLPGPVLAGLSTDKSARQVFWLVSGLLRLPMPPVKRRHSDDNFGKPLHETYSSGTARDSHPVPF